MAETILEVRDLVTTFSTEGGLVRAVDKVSFSLKKGQTLGIVGESGSGKSVTSLSLIDLLPKPSGKVAEGEVLFNGQNLRLASDAQLHDVRGKNISMIFQEPMTSLNPVKKIGKQLAEVYKTHFPDMSKKQVDQKCLALLEDVGIPAPKQRLGEYPHQLSGGMRQRVMIAMALACEPDVLIADEPTTALDVTIQAQILDLMERLQKEHGMAMIFITHDLGVIAEIADHVAVMYGGRIVESAPVEELFKNPSHPYTKGLLSSIPRLDGASKVRLETIEGMVPSLHDMPEGCRFENRCPYSDDGCTKQRPPVTKIGPSHTASCLRLGMLDGEGANA